MSRPDPMDGGKRMTDSNGNHMPESHSRTGPSGDPSPGWTDPSACRPGRPERPDGGVSGRSRTTLSMESATVTANVTLAYNSLIMDGVGTAYAGGSARADRRDPVGPARPSPESPMGWSGKRSAALVPDRPIAFTTVRGHALVKPPDLFTDGSGRVEPPPSGYIVPTVRETCRGPEDRARPRNPRPA